LSPDEVTVRPPLMVTPPVRVAPLDAVSAPPTESVLNNVATPFAVIPCIFVLPATVRPPLLTFTLPDSRITSPDIMSREPLVTESPPENIVIPLLKTTLVVSTVRDELEERTKLPPVTLIPPTALMKLLKVAD
jgi:hypothetical protein